MWKNDSGRFDAAVWRGAVDFTTASVRLFLLAALAILWFGLGLWFLFLL